MIFKQMCATERASHYGVAGFSGSYPGPYVYPSGGPNMFNPLCQCQAAMSPIRVPMGVPVGATVYPMGVPSLMGSLSGRQANAGIMKNHDTEEFRAPSGPKGYTRGGGYQPRGRGYSNNVGQRKDGDYSSKDDVVPVNHGGRYDGIVSLFNVCVCCSHSGKPHNFFMLS